MRSIYPSPAVPALAALISAIVFEEVQCVILLLARKTNYELLNNTSRLMRATKSSI
jgi:hypothetical protein